MGQFPVSILHIELATEHTGREGDASKVDAPMRDGEKEGARDKPKHHKGPVFSKERNLEEDNSGQRLGQRSDSLFDELIKVPYLDEIVIGLDRASAQEYEQALTFFNTLAYR